MPLLFAVEEYIRVGAFVVAGFEVDDPADAVLVGKTSVDYDVDDLAVKPAGQRPFGFDVAVFAGEYPGGFGIIPGVVDGRGDLVQRRFKVVSENTVFDEFVSPQCHLVFIHRLAVPVLPAGFIDLL